MGLVKSKNSVDAYDIRVHTCLNHSFLNCCLTGLVICNALRTSPISLNQVFRDMTSQIEKVSFLAYDYRQMKCLNGMPRGPLFENYLTIK